MKLLRLLCVAPVALVFAGVASAQTTGSIIGVVTDAQSGKPVAGALVVASSPNLQGEQTVVTDKAGAFRIQALPPGDYKLAAQFDGYKTAERSDLNVRLDKTIRANLSIVPEAVTMEEQVVKTGMAPVINVGNAETGTVVSRDFVNNVPVSRGFQNVAVVAPGATFDTYGVSFAGTSSPENNYIVDGMNVGDPAFGTLGANILSNFLQEIDVKSGSFMPEYGFATGGIVNVVTKSGSNEFHGSVFANLDPGALRGTDKPVFRNAEAIGSRLLPRDGAYTTDFGAEVGGPILKDRLWFYVGFAPQLRHNVRERFLSATQYDAAGNPLTDPVTGLTIGREIAGSGRKFDNDRMGYQLASKLTFLINENNNLAVSFINSPTTDKQLVSSNSLPTFGYAKTTDDFMDVIGRYSSKLLDKKLLVELSGGYHQQEQLAKDLTVDGVDQFNTIAVQWQTTAPLSWFQDVPAECAPQTFGATTQQPCAVTNFWTGGGGFLEDTKLNRIGGKATVSYMASLAGSHQFKGGADIQRSNFDHSKFYSGGQTLYLRTGRRRFEGSLVDASAGPAGWAYQNRQFGEANNTGTGSVVRSPLVAKSATTSQGYFLQDSYSPIDGLTINGGVRWEMQTMNGANETDAPSFTVNDSIAPRAQVIYDWTKQGRSKISANWGRFYQAFPLDMADRSFNNESLALNYYPYCRAAAAQTDKSATAIAALPSSCLATPVANYYAPGVTHTTSGGFATVSPNLKSGYSDVFGAAVEYEVLPDLSVGFDYTGRRVGAVIEDMSNDDGNTYVIANPGQGKGFTQSGGAFFDPTLAQATDPVTGRQFTTPFPKPKREYDGFTVNLRKNYSNHWQGLLSYTYSSNRGNYPGLFRPEDGQLDPGITSEFDLVGLLGNRDGPLPQDVPHQFKAFGSYSWEFGPRVAVSAGAAVKAQSGFPVSYLSSGNSAQLYLFGTAFPLPRGSAGRTPFQTTVDLKAAMTYTIKVPYTAKLSVDVFNVFNQQYAETVDQNWTFDDAQPIQNGQCKSRNAVSATDKVGAALADCPDLAYLKSWDGRPVTINKNFGRPANTASRNAYTLPVSFRFGLELAF